VSEQTQTESPKVNNLVRAPDPHGALKFRRAFLLLLVAGISILFLMMIGRFLIAVFLAAVLAGVSQPLYRWLKARVGYRRRVASLVTILVLVLGVALPLAGFLTIVAAQALQVGEGVGAWLQDQQGRLDEIEASVRRIPVVGRLLPNRAELSAYATSIASRTGSVLFGTFIDATRGTLNFLLQLFIVLYSLYFFLTGPDVLKRMMSYTPLSAEEEERLLERFVSVTRATLKGSLLIGVLQGALAGMAFWVAGVPGAAFWGTVMVVLSIIPAVGAGLVWIPAVIYLFLAGSVAPAFGLLAWCALVVSTVDNFLRPRLIGRDARMSDLLILLSTLGGIVLFGAVGFVVGPIIAALFVTVWQIYGEVFRDWLPERARPLLQDREGTPIKEGTATEGTATRSAPA
jgi:predicted PurR-regulated permease PerM